MTCRDRTESADSIPEIGPDRKLADLMMRGWVMLAETCPVETCGCPLMKNFEGQKYCVGCEMWHFDKDRPIKQNFGELVSLQGKQNIQLKNNKSTELSKVQKNMIDYEMTLNKSVTQSLQLKLAYLSSMLNVETDISKTKEILECIKICIENIQSSKNI